MLRPKVKASEFKKFGFKRCKGTLKEYLMQLNDMKKHGELVKSDERKLESLMELHRKESEKYAQS